MKITKNMEAANKGFWKVTSEARNKVENKWPEWKKNVKVTNYSVGFSTKNSKKEISH